MIKLFGYNILKDWELERVKEDQWDNFKKYLKIKELYGISMQYKRVQKCPNCDYDRRINVKLPDGTFTKVSCSCSKDEITFKVIKTDKPSIIGEKDKRVYVSDQLDRWDITERILFNKHQFKEIDYLEGCYFTSEKLANEAIKIIEKQRSDK